MAGAADVISAPPVLAPGGARRAEIALWAIVAVMVAVLLGAALVGINVAFVAGAFAVPLVLVSFQQSLLSWQTMLGVVLVVILVIPIRRYTIAAGGPIELEPYRVLIALVLGCWFLALAADPKVRWRATGYGAPITVLWLGIFGSLALNIGSVNANSTAVLKALTFFASYFLVLAFVSSVVRRGAQLDRMIKLLVGGSALLGLAALYEWRTGVNLFNGLGRFLPFLVYQDIGDAMIRGSGARALASAQHPIALGAALVMMLPLSIYLFKRTGSKIWLVAGGLLTLGALATGSRTAAIMLLVVFIVFFVHKRDEMIKMAPVWLVLLVVIQGVMPGTLQSFKFMLNPSYIASEQSVAGGTGQGRLADVGPTLSEWAHGNPFVGQGFGTRAPADDANPNGAQILDDQWLGSLLEVGAVGLIGLWWLYGRGIRMTGRLARTGKGDETWLGTALCASLTAWMVGLFTYDAFAFIQATFFSFILLGFASVAAHRTDSQSV